MTPIREKGDWPLNPFWEKGDDSKKLGRWETAKKFREKGDGLCIEYLMIKMVKIAKFGV